MNLIGVYRITHTPSEKHYVGSASDIKRRFSEHKRSLRAGTHHNVHLQRAWDKYGESEFQFVVLEECADSLLLTREQFWFEQLGSITKGFNIVPIAGKTTGYKATPEQLNARSILSKELMSDPKRRLAIEVSMYGNQHAKGKKQSIEVAKRLKDLKNTPEWKAQHSARMKAYWAQRKAEQI